MDYVPKRSTGLHIRDNIYLGRFDNVKHQRIILSTGHKAKDGRKEEYRLDDREVFDTRIKDDMIRANQQELMEAMQRNFDVFRPANTLSCPQLGVDFMHR